MHRPMRAPRPNEPQISTSIPEKDQILPQDADLAHGVILELYCSRNRMPVTPHQLPAWRARSHPRQHLVFFPGQHIASLVGLKSRLISGGGVNVVTQWNMIDGADQRLTIARKSGEWIKIAVQ
jgi:hypothetical protein